MNIPRVRRWRVTFYREGHSPRVVEIETINKRFARWLANERAGYIGVFCNRITVAPIGRAQSLDGFLWARELEKSRT